MARSIPSLAGYGMDYIDDIIAHASSEDVASPLRSPPPLKKLKASTTPASTPENEFVDDEEASKTGSEAKENPILSVLSDALKKKIEEDKRAKKEHIDALVAKLKPPSPKKCKYCEHAPCVVNAHYNDLMCMGCDIEIEQIAEKGESDNKAIRFALYREMSNRIWGHLGKGVRKQLPKCVVGEIHDAFPTQRGQSYVGFKPLLPYDSYNTVTVMSGSEEEEEK
jgi:hypothetical protein